MNDENPIPVRLPGQLSRREAMQWVLAAVAASSLPGAKTEATTFPTTHPVQGYGRDPDLLTPNKPGKLWPLTMTPAERKSTKALADVIIPKDQFGPAASEVGVVEMLDEWISAPYPQQVADRPTIINGIAWIDAEAAKRFNKSFAELAADQQRAICDDICFAPEAKDAFKKPSHFFARFRSLCASAYYATPAGWEAIGYVGNVPLQQFDGPPVEVLQKLGLS